MIWKNRLNNIIPIFIIILLSTYCLVFAASQENPLKEISGKINPGGETYQKMLPKGELYKQAKQIIEKKGGGIAGIGFLLNEGTIIPNLCTLSRYSDEIIIGQVNNPYFETYIDDDGELYTIYKLLVTQNIKGDIDTGNVVEIRIKGGSWTYLDGVSLVKIPVDTRFISVDKYYAFFLKKNNADDEYYDLSVGAQSIYELDYDSNSIIPSIIKKSDPLVMKYEHMKISDFLDEINKDLACVE
jgi:hypothetical protein